MAIIGNIPYFQTNPYVYTCTHINAVYIYIICIRRLIYTYTSQLSSLFSEGRGPIPWAQKWGHEFGCWASYTQLFGPEFGHPFAAARHKQERSVRAATTDPLVWAHPPTQTGTFSHDKPCNFKTAKTEKALLHKKLLLGAPPKRLTTCKYTVKPAALPP
jgi:hypothetical protein